MATGILFPPRQIAQTRLQVSNAETAFGRHTFRLKAGILRVVSITRVIWRRLMSAINGVLRHQDRVRQRQRAQFVAFEHQFEGLVDLLCASAREGVNRKRESEYQQRREWMRHHYPSIAKQIRSHVATTQYNQMDPFHSLYCPLSLEETINIASTIEDIYRARVALEAYSATFESAAE